MGLRRAFGLLSETLCKETLMATKNLKSPPRKPTLSIVSATPTGGESRRTLIERAAYLRAERRGFEPGHELDDWCAAEREIDDQVFRGEICAS